MWFPQIRPTNNSTADEVLENRRAVYPSGNFRTSTGPGHAKDRRQGIPILDPRNMVSK